MSADMMIICEEDGSNYENPEGCIFIDETSMGEPHHEFGRWFQSRFCGAPSLLDQLLGNRGHIFTLVTNADVVAVKYALRTMRCHEELKKEAVMEFFGSHVGKRISTENW